jgi:hypothetical protein
MQAGFVSFIRRRETSASVDSFVGSEFRRKIDEILFRSRPG